MLKGFPVAAAATEVALGAADGAVASHDINHPPAAGTSVLHQRSMQAQLATAGVALLGCAVADGRHKTLHEASLGGVFASFGYLIRRGAYTLAQRGQTNPVRAQGDIAGVTTGYGYAAYTPPIASETGAAGAIVPPLPNPNSAAVVGAAG